MILRVPICNFLNLVFEVSLVDILHLCEHLHGEAKRAALILALRLDIESATVGFNDTLANHEAHANTFRVLACRPFQFSKHAEQCGHLSFCNSSPRIHDVHLQLLLHFVIGRKNFYSSMPRELQGIFDQIYQDLLQAYDVTVEYFWQRGFLQHNHIVRHIVGLYQ